VRELFEKIEKRDPAEILPASLPEPIDFSSHREFVREVIANETDLRSVGTQFVPKEQVPADSPSIAYRNRMNARISPSNVASAGYVWRPGTELSRAEDVAKKEAKAA
jgi:hypothetical protein